MTKELALISLNTIICTIPEPEPETRAFWSNPTRNRPEVKKTYSSWPDEDDDYDNHNDEDADVRGDHNDSQGARCAC